MTGILLQKEIRQHWPWFIILTLLTWFSVFVACIGYNAEGTGAGVFAGVGVGLSYMMPVSGLILGHLLVATEYRLNTQLFLEGLPLPRWRMIATKLILALFLTCFLAVGSILIGWLFSFGTEPVTPKFLGILISSATGWAAFITGFFFVMGFLGRYRTIILITIGITLLILKFNSAVPIDKFPPFALIKMGRFGLERDIWPIFDLQMTWLMIFGWGALAFILGLSKEGSIASMLGERMSYREKLFIGGAAIIALYSYLAMHKPPKPEPFDIPGSISEEWNDVQVFISSEEVGNPVDLEISIANKLARRLSVQRDWLGFSKEEFPRIYVVEKSDIEEPEKISWEEVADPDAILMYAGYRQPEFSENRLLCWTLSQIIRKHSLERVGQEDRWWIVCGLEGLWELEEADSKTEEERIEMAVEAVQKHGLTVENLFGWAKYQDDVEWRSADAVAWMGMRHLKEIKGIETVQALARRTITKSFSRADARAVIWDYTNPVSPAFAKAVGLDLDEFVEQWRSYILSYAKEGETP